MGHPGKPGWPFAISGGVTPPMLVQATTPRPVFDPAEFPRYVYVHTLYVPDVSDGEVYFNATTNPEFGRKQGRSIDPIHTYDLEGGLQVQEYVLPFFELFKTEQKNQNLGLVPYCTAGFGVVVKSGFRADFTTYQERTISFQMMMPVTGGGVIRMADSFFDIANSSFDPWAPSPTKGRDLIIQMAAQKAHKLSTPEIDARRAARVKAAEAAMVAETKALPAPRRLLGGGDS